MNHKGDSQVQKQESMGREISLLGNYRIKCLKAWRDPNAQNVRRADHVRENGPPKPRRLYAWKSQAGKAFLCSWNQKEAKLSGAKYESDKKWS